MASIDLKTLLQQIADAERESDHQPHCSQCDKYSKAFNHIRDIVCGASGHAVTEKAS